MPTHQQSTPQHPASARVKHYMDTHHKPIYIHCCNSRMITNVFKLVKTQTDSTKSGSLCIQSQSSGIYITWDPFIFRSIEMGKHPGWDPSPSSGTMHTFTRSLTLRRILQQTFLDSRRKGENLQDMWMPGLGTRIQNNGH